MTDNKPPKYIIVLGTTYSGSGAVLDYLEGRSDLYSPLKGKEYLLPQSPNGLMCLEAAAGQAFHHATSDYVVNKFIELANIFGRENTKTKLGYGYSKLLSNYNNELENFLNKIIVADFPLSLMWHTFDKKGVELFYQRLKSKLGVSVNPPKTKVTCEQDALVDSAQEFHDAIFNFNNFKKQPIILDQAGSGWNPIESTKYFRNRKVVLVTRSPLDQYAELKLHKRSSNVTEFIKWYKALERRLNNIDSDCLLKIKYEDFVLDNKVSKQLICSFLGLDTSVVSSYEPEKSLPYIGQYKTQLEKNEISVIKNAFY